MRTAKSFNSFTVAALIVVMILASACARATDGDTSVGTPGQGSSAGEATLAPSVATPSGLYDTMSDDAPTCDVEKEADAFVKPVLKQVFGGAKLKKCDACGKPLTCMKYALARQMTQDDAKALYDALVAAGAEKRAEPRVYSASNTIEFSVTATFPSGKHMVGFVMDLQAQMITLRVF